MCISLAAEVFILLDKEDDIVRITINDGDIWFGVLGLTAGEKPQLFASAKLRIRAVHRTVYGVHSMVQVRRRGHRNRTVILFF
jgi:hypothetical protein